MRKMLFSDSVRAVRVTLALPQFALNMGIVNWARRHGTNEQAVIYTEGRAVMRFTAVHANKKWSGSLSGHFSFPVRTAKHSSAYYFASIL